MTSRRLSVRVDQGVGGFTVSPSGRDVALASRNGLFVLDLENPLSPPRWLPLHTIWEVADVQWCRHQSHNTWVISTSNQKAIIWNLALPSHRAIEHVLHAHSRAITDINFNPQKPDLLATCSVDTRIHVWDTRTPKLPARTFADFDAGATQVRWNNVNPHVLASAHSRRILIWDDRKNNEPLYTINGHSGQVNGLDWEKNNGTRILSCSTDRSLKKWDMRQSTVEPISEIVTTFPVWRAKHMPLGPGCLLSPLRGGDNSAYLIDLNDAGRRAEIEPLVRAKFSGHTQPIKEFGLRRMGDGYDVITLSNDHHLNLWPLIREDLYSVEFPFEELPTFPSRDITYHDSPYEPDNKAVKYGSFKPFMLKEDRHNNDHLDWIAGVRLSAMPIKGNSNDSEDAPAASETAHINLSKEITRIGAKFPKIHFEHIDLSAGVISMTLRGPWGNKDELLVLRVTVKFPPEYPFKPLGVQVEEDELMDPTSYAEMEEYLQRSTKELATNGIGSLEFCLRYLMGDRMSLGVVLDSANDEALMLDTFPDVSSSDEEEYGGRNEVMDEMDDDVDMENPQMDEFSKGMDMPSKIDSTPLPKQCGGVWTSRGELLCFFNYKQAVNGGDQHPLPLEKVFAADESDEESVYESDSDDFGPDPADINWSMQAVKLTMMSRGAPAKESMDGTASTSSHISNRISAENRIELYNFYDLMPSRPDLAMEYAFNFGGDPVAMAMKNAEIADKYGRFIDAYLWKVILYMATSDEKFLPIEPGPDMAEAPIKRPIFKWAEHPYGDRGLGSEIVRYLVESQNIQLLATMSVIFIEVCFGPYRERPTMPYYRKQTDQKAPQKTHFHFNIPTEAPAGTSVGPVAVDLPTYSAPQAESVLLTTHLLASSTKNGISSAASPLSPQKTGPGMFQPWLSSGGLTPTMASRPRSFTSDMDSGQSPDMMDFSHQLPFKPSMHRNMSVSSAVSDAPSGHIPDYDATLEVVNIVPYSEECIEDGSFPEEFMNEFLGWQGQFAHYRVQYARLLETWGLHLQRLEILKHNYYDQNAKLVSSQEYQVEVELASRGGNYYTGSDAVQRQCRFCNQYIETQFTHCCRCHHILHRHCAETWWANAEECPSGCGCRCIDYV